MEEIAHETGGENQLDTYQCRRARILARIVYCRAAANLLIAGTG